MDQSPDFPPGAFAKTDATPDELFYRTPRLVAHIDPRAIAVVTALYRRVLPAGGAVLDLMSSWISHLPAEVAYGTVVGLGLNAVELETNPRLDRRLVQDLNARPALPFGSESFDAAAICVSAQYLQQPVAVLGEVARVLRPGAPVVITISDRCFPTKAVAIWHAFSPEERPALVALYLDQAGFADVEAAQLLSRDGGGDPLWSVVGRKPRRSPATGPRSSS